MMRHVFWMWASIVCFAHTQSMAQVASANTSTQWSGFAWFYPVLSVAVICMLLVIAKIYFWYRMRALMRKNEHMRQLLNQIIAAFARTIDLKDKYTNGHSMRVAKYSATLATAMGLSAGEVEQVYNTGMLHDVGKVLVPDAVLNKPEGLNGDEYAVIKSHVVNGEQILKEIKIFPDIYLGAKYHHEHVDGRGYIEGLRGDEIPLVARIIAVADMYDAMRSTRPYRKKMPIDQVLSALRAASGTQLDPAITAILIQQLESGQWQDDPSSDVEIVV